MKIKGYLSGESGENLFNEEFIPNYNSKEILDLFYETYLDNLRKSHLIMRWVRLDEIEDKVSKSWNVIGDKFLKDSSSDWRSLAKDLIDNGTFWPIYLSEKKKGIYPIRDGIHRISCMKAAEKNGMIKSGKKMLAVIRKSGRPLINEIYKIPSPLSVNHVLLGIHWNYYKKFLKNGNFEYADKNRMFIYVEDQFGEMPTMLYSLMLRNAIFEYNQNNVKKFKGSKFINNEEEFYKWRDFREEGAKESLAG